MLKKLRQLFCRHRFVDVTTKENEAAGIRHWLCYRCREVASLGLNKQSGFSVWTAHVDPEVLKMMKK